MFRLDTSHPLVSQFLRLLTHYPTTLYTCALFPQGSVVIGDMRVMFFLGIDFGWWSDASCPEGLESDGAVNSNVVCR